MFGDININITNILQGAGIILLSTLVSSLIIGQKIYLYYINEKDAKNSKSSSYLF